MKTFVMMIWLLLLAGLGFAQPTGYDKIIENEYHTTKVELDGKFGLVNSQGKLLTKYWYEHLGDKRKSRDIWQLVYFKEKPTSSRKKYLKKLVTYKYSPSEYLYYYDTLALVKRNGLWGLINQQGVEVVTPKYDNISNFKNGYAFIWKNGKMGVINQDFKEVLAPIYLDIRAPYQGVFRVNSKDTGILYEGKWSLIIGGGKVLTKLKYDTMTPFKENGLAYVRYKDKCGYVDTSGREVVPLKYASISGFQDGVAIAQMELNGVYGLVNKKGKEITPFKYHNIKGFNQGRAAASIDGEKYIPASGRWGIIDNQGREITPFKYRKIYGYSQGVVTVMVGGNDIRNEGEWGLVNRQGKEITPLKYKYIRNFYEGVAAVCIGTKWGYLDTTGKEITPIKYDCLSSFQKGIGEVTLGCKMGLGGKTGLINRRGKLLTPMKYGKIESYHNGRYIIVTVGNDAMGQGGKQGLIDSTGREIIKPIYDALSKITETAYRVKLNNKWGIVDMKGKMRVAILYDWIDYFHGGIAIARLPRKGESFRSVIYNKAWQKVVPTVYKSITRFKDGWASVFSKQGYGIIDTNGKVLFSSNYRYISGSRKGLAVVVKGKYPQAKWGVIDKRGKVLLPVNYQKVRILEKNLVAFKQGGKWYFKQVK